MPPRAAPPQAPSGGGKPKTVEWRRWKGINRTDARTAVADDELPWEENAVTVGDGAIQILPRHGVAVATIAAGVVSLWGFTLNGQPVLISVNTDGSMTQITPGGVTTAVAAAGSVTASAHLTMWQGTPILIIDPTKGYSKWDGTTYTVISAGVVGSAIAVFEGRAWIGGPGRTIQFTAPNTFDDFTVGNGASSFVITDDAFAGNIVALYSALEELWIIGESAIDALANVQASGTPPSVATTFSVTNIVTNLGTTLPNSVIGYLRALTLLAPFGAYALSGVTPQKLSDKLDGLFPQLTLTGDAPAAVAVVQNLLALLFLVTYTGTDAQAGAGPIPLILGFVKGQWFFGSQGTGLKWITSLVVSGVAQAWGTDGSAIYQCFGASAATPVKYKVQTKLSDFGQSTMEKAATKVALEVQSSFPLSPTLTVDSESSSEVIALDLSNQVQWVNAAGDPVSWLNSLGQQVTWTSQGLVLGRAKCEQFGHYLGFTYSGEDPPHRLQMVGMEVTPTRAWSTP